MLLESEDVINLLKIPEGEKYGIHCKMNDDGGSLHISAKEFINDIEQAYINKLSIYVRPECHSCIQPNEEKSALYLGMRLNYLENIATINRKQIYIIKTDIHNKAAFDFVSRSCMMKRKDFFEFKMKSVADKESLIELVTKLLSNFLDSKVVDMITNIIIEQNI